MKTLKNLLCLCCFFMVFNLTAIYAITKADKTEIKTLKTFQGRCHDLGLFLGKDRSLVVFCRAANYSGDGKSKIFLFSQQHDKWSEEEKSYVGSTSRIISDGKFQLATYGDLRQPESSLEVYDLSDDLQITDQPRFSLDLFSEQKFKKEFKTSYREIHSVVAQESPDSFLVLGEYTANNLNLFTFFGRILTAGHAGIVDIPFAAQITEGKVTGFYNLQTKYEDNEYVSDMKGVTEGRVVHITWIKRKNYSSDAHQVMYAQFDLEFHRWSDVTELFRGTKDTSKIVRYISEPSVLLLDQKFYCAWSNAAMQDDRGQPLEKPLGSSGVFYRVRNKDGWGLIEKVSDSQADRCKLAAGKDKEVHLFWIDYQNKVYHACQDGAGWQDASVIYEDSALDWTLPFDVKIDQTGDIYLIYIRRTSHAAPSELMYVKVKVN